jgi:ATP-dependent 26S proteasome regulatory subunit
LEELHRKLGAALRCLEGWNNHEFGNVKQELKNLNARLKQLRSEPLRIGPSYEEIKTVDMIVEPNYREKVIWRQHSRVTWLKGDKNTRFFSFESKPKEEA